MGPFNVNQNLGYGICLNSCDCEVFNKRHTTVIKKGCLAKFQYRELDQNRSVLTLITNKSELYVREFLSYNLIDHKLFKYLNAINDFEERLKFYKNGERREFVLYLEKNSVVSVGFSSGKQIKAVFHEIYENEKKIFITVELLKRPFKYSLPANMVHKIGSLDSSHNNNRLFFCCLPIFTPSFNYSALAYWRCYDNVQNGNTSNVSRGKSVSKSVQPVKKKIISQNSRGSRHKTIDKSDKPASNNEPINDFSRKTVERNAKRGENRRETRVVSALIVPSSLPTDLLINSEVCYVCSEVCEGNICRTCDNQTKSIFDQNNFQTIADSNLSAATSLLNHKPIKSSVCLECSNVCEGNNCRNCDNEAKNIVGQNNSKTNVVLNISEITILSSHTTTKSRVCPNCSKECEDNICRICDNQMKNNFCQNNFQTNADSNISAITRLSNYEPIKLMVCPKCSNEYEGNICRTCDNEAKNIFGPDNSRTNVVSNISAVTSLFNHKPINSSLCSECSTEYEGNICHTCDNEANMIFGQNNSQSKFDSNISLDTNLFTQKLINLQTNKLCGLCSNVCEGNICLSCVNETQNMFGQNNSKINHDSNISSDTSLSTDIPTNWDVCVECLRAAFVNEGNICLSCDLKKISGQNNFQTKIGSIISLDKNLFSETPITPVEINYRYVTNEDHLPDNSKIAVRHNISPSNCIICKKHLNVSDGFLLILCEHTFCELCIKNQISLKMLAHTNIMPCCDRPIEQDEIKYFLFKDEYEQFKALSKQQCFDKNCSGYHLLEKCVEEGLITFKCNKCKLDNCLKCEAIHVNLTCEQYDKITREGNSVDKETAEMFLTWIRDGVAMPCPKCEALIEKDEGCDWVQCPFCNVEICWATRGPRWGPDGKGDTSGGCRCDFKVKKCVDNCNYCH